MEEGPLNVSSSTTAASESRKMGTDQTNDPFQCAVCAKMFKQKFRLNAHMRRYHLKLKPHVCEVCSKAFTEKHELKKHALVHDSSEVITVKHECEQCGKHLSKSHLPVHRLSHCGVKRDKPYRCHICEKAFVDKRSLTRHLCVHAGIKPYGCDICAKTFTGKDDLAKHVRTHSGTKPFVCAVCGKGFARRNALNVHIWTHEEKTPFGCEICGKCMSTETALKNHYARHGLVGYLHMQSRSDQA